MTKAENIEKRWATTLRFLYAVDVVLIAIITYFIFNRMNGNPGFPSYVEIFLITIVIILGNTVLFFFMRSIKNAVKGITKEK